MIKIDKWKWFGNAGHFICGSSCRFHLATQVGQYLVSTVGQYWPERGSREIHAKIRDIKWHEANKHLLGDYYDAAYMKRFGYEQIGYNRLFETMVFKLKGEVCTAKECNCGLPEIEPSNLDFSGTNTAGEAMTNHIKLCKKWSKK